jgi:hydrogenase maturation protease
MREERQSAGRVAGAQPPTGASSVILGIGNTLLGDEGAGVHALARLRARGLEGPDLHLLDGGTLGFTLAPAIEAAAALVVIDATGLSAAPGTVRVFEGAAMDRFLGAQRRRSVHEIGLLDLLAIARLTDSLPARRALIGIQPGQVDWADRPTPAVARGIERAADATVELLAAWQRDARARLA